MFTNSLVATQRALGIEFGVRNIPSILLIIWKELDPSSVKVEKSCDKRLLMMFEIFYYVFHTNRGIEVKKILWDMLKRCQEIKIMVVQSTCHETTGWEIKRKEYESGSRLIKIWDRKFFRSHILQMRSGFTWIHEFINL